MAAKLIRAISGVIMIFQCLVLIAFFGVLPLLGYKACPVLGAKAGSVYGDGSLAFVREMDASELIEGDVAVYYLGRTAVGYKVNLNDKSSSAVSVAGDKGGVSVPYAKIVGKGTDFCVPALGNYADWLVHGKGLLTSVIVIGALFVVFGVSAFCVREKPEV